MTTPMRYCWTYDGMEEDSEGYWIEAARYDKLAARLKEIRAQALDMIANYKGLALSVIDELAYIADVANGDGQVPEESDE